MNFHEHPPSYEPKSDDLELIREELDRPEYGDRFSIKHDFFEIFHISSEQSQALFDFLRQKNVIDSQNFLDKSSLDAVIELLRQKEGVRASPASHEESLEQESDESRRIFAEILRALPSEQLVQGVGYGEPFTEERRKAFFDHYGVDGVKTIAQNIADFFRAEELGKELHEFKLFLYPGERTTFNARKREIGFGVEAFDEAHIEKTRHTLKGQIESVRGVFFEELREKLEEKVRGCMIAPALKEDLLRGSSSTYEMFFRKLNMALDLESLDEGDAIDLHEYQVRVSGSDSVPLRISPGVIALNIDAFKDEEAARSTAQGIRQEINDWRERQQQSRGENSESEEDGAESPSRTLPQGPEAMPLRLGDARRAYAEAYNAYLDKHKGSAANHILNIAPDADLEKARKQYDEALKETAKVIRDFELQGLDDKENAFSREQGTALANKKVFEQCVIREEAELAKLKADALPPERKGLLTRAWRSYARLSKTKKMLISVGIGATVAVTASGVTAGTALLHYAGRRLFSFGTIAATNMGLEGGFRLYDRTYGKKHTKEYQVEQMFKNQKGDIVEDFTENMEDLRREYSAILDAQAKREKKRLALKVGINVLVGMGIGAEFSHHHAGDAVVSKPPSGVAHGSESTPLSHDTSHSAPLDSVKDHVPGAGIQEAPVPPSAEGAHVAHDVVLDKTTDSVWKAVASELEKDPAFHGLKNEAEKTWVISTLTNRALAHHTEVGFAHADAIRQGTTLHLGEVLQSNEIHKLVEHAQHHLTAAQQEHILEHNRAIHTWVREHPHQRFDESHVEPVHHSEHLHKVDSEPQSIGPTKTETSPFGLYSEDPQVQAWQHEIGGWSGKGGTEAAKLLHELNIKNIQDLSWADRSRILSALAERVGDKSSGALEISDAAAVAARVKDYVVAYPEAQHFGFKNYAEYIGVRDMTMRDLTKQIPLNGHWSEALRHSEFHPGEQFRELHNGKWQTVAMKPEHVQLATALERIVKAHEGTKTVGQVLREHAGELEGRAATAKRMVKKALLRAHGV